jgi:hypothetical protein
MTFKMTPLLAQELAELLSHHLQDMDAPSRDIIRVMAEIEVAEAECFRLAAPPVDATTEELLDAARALIALPMPLPGFFARQARRRRARLYFRYLLAAWRHDASSWRAALLEILTSIPMVGAGIAYAIWGRQTLGGAR